MPEGSLPTKRAVPVRPPNWIGSVPFGTRDSGPPSPLRRTRCPTLVPSFSVVRLADVTPSLPCPLHLGPHESHAPLECSVLPGRSIARPVRTRPLARDTTTLKCPGSRGGGRRRTSSMSSWFNVCYLHVLLCKKTIFHMYKGK